MTWMMGQSAPSATLLFLGGGIYASDGFAIIQRYLKTMEKEVNRNIVKFNSPAPREE